MFVNIDRHFGRGLPMLGVFACWCALFIGLPTRAAYISEIDLGGPTSPAGQAIEFSGFGSAPEHTLLIINFNPSSGGFFGAVLDAIDLPASIGFADVALVTEQPLPDNTAVATTLSSLDSALGSPTFAFGDTRLLVLVEGRSELGLFNNPLSNPAATELYNQTTVTDWLVLTNDDQAAQLQDNHDIDAINATLGIDLLSRLVDTSTGRVVGRTLSPDAQLGDAIDASTFFVGTPDAVSQQFDTPDGSIYTYTPGRANLPLSHLPEPNTLAIFALSAGFLLRRSRQTPSC